jgi:predicted DsbA family dithiol-disulfide isomerase
MDPGSPDRAADRWAAAQAPATVYPARVRTPLLPSALVVLVALSACSGDPGHTQTPVNEVVLPHPAGAEPYVIPPASDGVSAQKALPGIDIDKLSLRERGLFWDLVSQLYAPCTEQAVSIAQCVQESRPCAACLPAATLLADKVHQGATAEEGRSVYATRFGPNLKKVDVADSPAKGPADAPVTIMVWSDFQCPHCRIALPMLDGIFEKFSPKVRLVHKFYPLHSHTTAEPSARAAIAAQNQGHYWEMERLLFGHQDAQQPKDLEDYGKQLQLDIKRYRADQTADATGKILARDRADADRSGLNGTPFILINGREFDLSFFHLETDLEAWVALEVELASKSPVASAKAAVAR